MKGFKDFIMRGNLIEIAVAFIVATAFAAVVKSFTDLLLEAIGKIFKAPKFDDWVVLGLTKFGPFLSALVAFLILAAVVYFFVVKPYEAIKARYAKAEEDAAPDEEVVLLREIRDALTRRI